MTLFPMAIITLFWKDQIGLSMTDILVLQAIFSGTSVLFEYPSGYLSDRMGYRSALMLASFLCIIGWSYYTIADSFGGVLLAEIILGMGWAFISGSDNALLYETLKAEKRDEQYKLYDGRMASLAQTGEAAGAIFAGLMYALWPLFPFVGQIGVWVVALILCWSLHEPETDEHTVTKSHLAEAVKTWHYAFIENQKIRVTILFGGFLGLASFYTVWLIQPYMQETGVPVGWLGPAWAGANLMVALGAILSHRLKKRVSTTMLVIIFIGLAVSGYIGLSVVSYVWGFLFYYLLTLMRGLQGPLMRGQLQAESDRKNRASILSLHSLNFRLLFVLTGPLVGYSADTLGLQGTFGVLAVLFAIVLIPTGLLFLKYSRDVTG